MWLSLSSGAGTGGLGLAIEGPSEAKMSCVDNLDGSCAVEYVPTEPGEYDVNIKFADQHIPGSPFKVSVRGFITTVRCAVWSLQFFVKSNDQQNMYI